VVVDGELELAVEMLSEIALADMVHRVSSRP
jgi:hypothetical protein